MLSILLLIAVSVTATAESGKAWGARDACVNLARIRSRKKKLSACVEGKELKGIPQSPQYHDRMERRPSEWESISGISCREPPGGARFNSPGGGQIHDVDAGDDHRFSFTLRRPASVV